MQNSTPFFSIIIPAYNIEKYIDRSVSSVLNQSFHDFEIIIVNDGSVDKTSDIIDVYAKKYENIKLINHLKNESQHIARMDGVAVSNGQYVIFLDGDDYFTDNALKILYNEIKNNPCYDFYEFGYIRQPSGKMIFPSFKEEDRFSAYFTRNKNLTPTMWNKAYDSILLKKAFSDMERTYINYSEDLYESIVIAFYAKKIFQIKNIIINYQIGTGLSTSYRDYDKTFAFMQSIKTLNILLTIFSKKINQNIKLDVLNYEYFSDTIDYIFNQKKNEDIKNLLLKIPDIFETEVILEYLFNKENSYRKLLPFINSIFYKPLIKIITVLRKIKKLFNNH